MAIDYTLFKIAKGTPRIVDRIEKKLALAQQERECRKAVKARDKGKCVVPGCKQASHHMHHIVYRSKLGKWRTENICSLCPRCHELVHLGKLRIEGNADEQLLVTGTRQVLGTRL